jgi:ubiquinone/menaquinone biosynthesis C-methylase UbiE
VVRNLALAGVASLAVAVIGPRLGPGWLRFLFFPGLSWLATAAWMVLGSKVLKLGVRDRLLERVALRPTDRVLDVGCGRGLLAIGAAKRATEGRVVGLDLWRSVDQSGNDPEVTRANAAAEQVAGRVELETADMTKMPFADGSFDVVVSSWAIHNVPSAEGRVAALREIARVLAPGGRLAIVDIGPGRRYGAALAAAGLADVATAFDNAVFLIPSWRVTATKPTR